MSTGHILHAYGYCVGTKPTLTDYALVSQRYSTERFGVDLSSYPVLIAAGVMARMRPASVAPHHDHQPDTDQR